MPAHKRNHTLNMGMIGVIVVGINFIYHIHKLYLFKKVLSIFAILIIWIRTRKPF